MLELLLCSLLTIFPDYLFRRYVQGKRIGKEITFYSVWFELRWGITACLILTVGLITVIFYNHPSTTSATLFFRTVPILPETNGRVAEIYFGRAVVSPRERRSSSLTARSRRPRRRPRAARSRRSRRRLWWREPTLLKAEGQLQEAKGSHQQALDELETKQELHRRNPGIVALRDIEKLEVRVEATQGAVAAATAAKQAAEVRVSTVLPAEKASAEAALAQALVELEKTDHTCRRERTSGAILPAGGRHRQSADAPGRGPDSRGCGSAKPAGRVWADRSADHEGRNDRRGDLRVEALDHHPDGGHGGTGGHRCRPIPRRRATARCAAGDAAGHASGVISNPSTKVDWKG